MTPHAWMAEDCEVVFGSDPSCPVRIDDPYVSPLHCVVSWSKLKQRFFVRDLGSSNGTRVEPASAMPFRLVPGVPCILDLGDQIRIGRTTLPWRVDR